MSVLYERSFRVNDYISISNPLVGDVLENCENYFNIIFTIVATPYDMMVQLDDAHIDFTKINDFELFCLMFKALQNMDTSLVFGDLDLTKFRTAISPYTNEVVLYDEEHDWTIDRFVHDKICRVIRTLFHMERTNKKPGNDEARDYELQKARKKFEREKRKHKNALLETTQLENYIVSLVNTEQFPYNYETVRDITIYQLYSSLYQIIKKISYDKTMSGYYAGTVKFEDIPTNERTWLKLE